MIAKQRVTWSWSLSIDCGKHHREIFARQLHGAFFENFLWSWSSARFFGDDLNATDPDWSTFIHCQTIISLKRNSSLFQHLYQRLSTLATFLTPSAFSGRKFVIRMVHAGNMTHGGFRTLFSEWLCFWKSFQCYSRFSHGYLAEKNHLTLRISLDRDCSRQQQLHPSRVMTAHWYQPLKIVHFIHRVFLV